MFLNTGRYGNQPQPGTELSDEALIDEYLLTGDKDLIGILFERYTHLVYGICLRYINDHEQRKDAVMEIFESLFDKLAVHKVSCFRNWLYSVARNHCLMMIRKAAGAERMRQRVSDESDVYAWQPDLRVPEEECLVQEAVGQLPGEQKRCLSLLYLEDKSYRDISETTGYSLNQVKSYVQNGKRNLKIYIQSRYDYY